MPVYTAPGTYVTVQDVSQYAAPISPTTAAVVGAAAMGPVLGEYNQTTNTYNRPILITTPSQFVSTFGIPNPNYQGPYAALLYLQQGNQLYYGRVVGSGATAASKVFDSRLTVDALSAGVWGNSISIIIADSFIIGAKQLSVLQLVDGEFITKESFDGLSNDPTSPNFYETIINATGTGSQFISVSYNTSLSGQPTDTTGDDPSVGPQEALLNGNDGLPPQDADIIGATYGGYSTGLYAFADADTINISLLAAPGYSSPNVISALTSIVESRQDCLGIIHGPLGLNAQEIVDWHNAAGAFVPGGNTPSVLIDSSSVALYWPWVQIFDAYNSVNVMVPPVGFALQRIAYNDNNAEPWYAPAGINRGKCPEALSLEWNATLGDREFMYGPGNGNAVNPIVNLPFDGITIYGQRTMQRDASSLDRINVRRLVFYMAKVLQQAVRSLVFEQNDAILWNQFKQIVAPFMADLQARRGVDSYQVVCDSTTNTAQAINNNQMIGYVLLVPTKTAEQIILNFALFASGATLSVPQIG